MILRIGYRVLFKFRYVYYKKKYLKDPWLVTNSEGLSFEK
ncbi:hypothetical protein CLSA_c18220 [Clostridium saccharobutylicum DSM 13864]|uniref:Uncharacterized protein n=1 Tax=Clostridium saccharobutylicum DSM 13864 TaxID=1345695 RepID=U5MQE4_CLOSA|nr:hypothetical protein CLSA_c18220 [Clostridium saccharobutylicum DSM 13864]